MTHIMPTVGITIITIVTDGTIPTQKAGLGEIFQETVIQEKFGIKGMIRIKIGAMNEGGKAIRIGNMTEISAIKKTGSAIEINQ